MSERALFRRALEEARDRGQSTNFVGKPRGSRWAVVVETRRWTQGEAETVVLGYQRASLPVDEAGSRGSSSLSPVRLQGVIDFGGCGMDGRDDESNDTLGRRRTSSSRNGSSRGKASWYYTQITLSWRLRIGAVPGPPRAFVWRLNARTPSPHSFEKLQAVGNLVASPGLLVRVVLGMYVLQ